MRRKAQGGGFTPGLSQTRALFGGSEPATVRSLAGRMADLASMTDWLEKPAFYRFLSLMSAWGWQFFENHDTIKEVVI